MKSEGIVVKAVIFGRHLPRTNRRKHEQKLVQLYHHLELVISYNWHNCTVSLTRGCRCVEIRTQLLFNYLSNALKDKILMKNPDQIMPKYFGND